MVSDLAGRVIHISDPVPGDRHDTRALNETGLSGDLDLDNTFADRGYQGTEATTPAEKKPGKPGRKELPEWVKVRNKFINTHRYVIEVT